MLVKFKAIKIYTKNCYKYELKMRVNRLVLR